MKRNIFTLIIALFIGASSYAQLSGTYYIPAGTPSYATVQAAVTDLNNQGISGNVTFIVADDYTETAPVGGIVLGSTLLNANSLTYSITFQRLGGGTNPPLIAAFIGTTTNLDGIWKIAGTDNVTIDGISLNESAGNIDQTQRMEFGYALLKLNSTAPFDGCQNVTIKNCSVTLNKNLTPSTFITCTGIYSSNHTATAIPALALTAASDVMSNCKFFNNTISNVSNGYQLVGYNGPLALFDQNTEIGINGANTITNFSLNGILTRQQTNLKIANNTFTSNTWPQGSWYGISTINSNGTEVFNNTVTLQSTQTSGSNNSITGMNLSISNDNTISGTIHDNLVTSCSNAGLNPTFNGIQTSGSPGSLTFYSNTVSNNTISGTGGFTGIDAGASAVTTTIYNNTVTGNSKTGTSGIFACLRVAGGGTSYAYDNLVNTNQNNTTAGAAQGGAMHGINISSTTTQIANVYANKVYDLNSGGANGVTNGINVQGPATANIYNNYISDLRTPVATTTTNVNAIAGINITSTGSNINVFFNSIFLNAVSSGTNFWTSAIFANTTPTVDLRNNILINLSTPAGTGITSAYRRSTTTLDTYSANSNANVFYAGDPEDATHAVFVNNTTPYNFAGYQTLVGPVRDAGSFRELPTFVNTTTTPYDLHIDATVATSCESNGMQVSSPVNITVDFDGNTRSATPDIGADEFTGIFTGVLNPSGVGTTLISSSQINVAFTPNPSSDNVVIVWSTTGAFTAPSGAPPTNPGDPFAGGTFLYNGTGSPIAHTSLTGATNYYYKAFSYDGTNYSTGVVTSNITNIAPPSGFTATPFSDTQIDLAWIKNAFNNDVLVATNTTNTFGQPVNGTSYNANDPLPTAGTVIYKGPANGFNHAGLTGNAAYYYKAWSVDQGNNNVYSPTGVTSNATTFCSPSTVPFAEGFEYGGALGCGTVVDGNLNGTWAAYYSTTYAHASSYSIRLMTGASGNDWYFTNGIQMTAGVTYEVKFWYRTLNILAPNHQFEVKWGTLPSDAGMNSNPVYLNSSLTATTTYIQVTCAAFTPAASGNYFIGLHEISPFTPGHHLFVDDITVTVVDVPASITWTGAANSEWFVSGNWNPAGVPGSGTAVTIPGGLTNYPAITNPATISSISIASGASLLDNGNLTVTGTSTVDRDYTGGEWHLISSPVAGATANMFLGLYLQQHNESTNLYTDISNPATPLNVMQGYALYNAVSASAQFSGNMNTGAVGNPNNVTRNNAGWNLVGNPYASYIDWDAASGWTKTNVDDATYRHVNSATWASYAGGVGTNGGTRYIAPCQGFFIGVTDGQTLGTLNMNNNVRTNSSSPFYKDEVADIVRLEVSGNGYTDETVIRVLASASTGFDGSWDAHKLFGSVPDAPAIFSTANGMMSINSIPAATNIPLGVKAEVAGEFMIRATETSEFGDVILEDILAGTFTNLKANSYTFSYQPGSDERFVLHFAALGIPEDLAWQVGVYSVNRNVIVSLPEIITGTIEIYNLLGQKVAAAGITGNLNSLTVEGGNYYLVRVLGEDMIVTKKVFVK